MDLAALLQELGLPSSCAGFRSITTAVELALADPRSLTSVTKRLYPQTAQQRQTTWKAVERNIRTSIHTIWRTDPHKLQQLTGVSVPVRPTPAQFLAILVYFVQEERARELRRTWEEEPSPPEGR